MPQAIYVIEQRAGNGNWFLGRHVPQFTREAAEALAARYSERCDYEFRVSAYVPEAPPPPAPPATTMPLDEEERATVLAALRMFQEQYEDMDASEIYQDWDNHFTRADGTRIEPLGSDDIDDLCEWINCEEPEAPVPEAPPDTFLVVGMIEDFGETWSEAVTAADPHAAIALVAERKDRANIDARILGAVDAALAFTPACDESGNSAHVSDLRESGQPAPTGQTCDECGEITLKDMIGCPDGFDICRECFNSGKH